MMRHEALQDLSRDHHHLLLHAREIRWYVDGDSRAAPFEEVVVGFLTSWTDEALVHLREEEEILFPLYTGHPSFMEDGSVARLLSDHDWLREQAVELARRWEDGAELRPLLEQIGRRLHDHIRFEERIVFERIQEIMVESELYDLHQRSLAFRKQWRGPEACGPRTEM